MQQVLPQTCDGWPSARRPRCWCRTASVSCCCLSSAGLWESAAPGQEVMDEPASARRVPSCWTTSGSRERTRNQLCFRKGRTRWRLRRCFGCHDDSLWSATRGRWGALGFHRTLVCAGRRSRELFSSSGLSSRLPVVLVTVALLQCLLRGEA